MDVAPEVAEALARGGAVVALESTIISHGMPYPQNVEVAKAVEDIVRSLGATPATIAVLGGRIKVGLAGGDLERLGKLGPRCAKVSRRDLAHCVGRGEDGATTVSGTLAVCEMAGIKVFVTGGIGGVHRGGERSMDVSADLVELGDCGGCAVVCAGVKSLLDIKRTLEVLETQGVTVATVGKPGSDFPAFFTAHSGCPSPLHVSGPEEAARVLRAGLDMKLRNGALFAVPIPEKDAAEGAVVEAAIRQALAEADQKGVDGRDVTPFLLKRINEITGGDSLKANIALIKNNARFGAQMAVHLAQLTRKAKM